MELELKRVEVPFVMELKNADGNTCLMDASPSIGGANKGFRPMELLAGAVAGCVSVDVLNILRKQKQEPNHYKVLIEAHRKDATPAPFETIHMVFEVDADIDAEKLSRNIQLVKDKYCSVSESMKDDVKITFEVKLV